MNWIDLVCLGVIVLSALSGLTRGFTREFIGLFGWVVAASLANRWYPDLVPKITPYISNETLADIASFAIIFLLCCIVINTLANVIVGQNSTRFSILGRLDRILGAACGAVKGFATLAIIYILGGIIFPAAQWPDTLQESQMVPYVYQGAAYINELLPSSMQRDIVVPQVKTPRSSYPADTNTNTNVITDPNAPMPATGQQNTNQGISPDY
ncbi:CvpA family protein [Commensalibacter nepenthis]|uniref:CvpA family protein n=1 Tax=Commensalibacter nepenthis TaxID=3043872 RepID=A0ABT6Q551_9PROT|nr:CvpA family protein [Commensalibacter sp. TBRC 10068]MDI2112006.1 CvpA family protein [Commensalibacter sp. TBRC 10068]